MDGTDIMLQKLLELGPWGIGAALLFKLASVLITRGFSVNIRVGKR
jgi:hypothetical protein